jgi:hypothetical protein
MSKEVCYLRASHHSAPVGIVSLQVSPHTVVVLSCKIDRSLFTYPLYLLRKTEISEPGWYDLITFLS